MKKNHAFLGNDCLFAGCVILRKPTDKLGKRVSLRDDNSGQERTPCVEDVMEVIKLMESLHILGI
jgi:hypothetical protein